MIPQNTPIKYTSPNIFIFSFISLFVLNSIIPPTPAPVESPAIIEPKLKAPSTYNLVSNTDAAQFGISPIILAINGWKIEPERIIFLKFSSPIKQKRHIAQYGRLPICIYMTFIFFWFNTKQQLSIN